MIILGFVVVMFFFVALALSFGTVQSISDISQHVPACFSTSQHDPVQVSMLHYTTSQYISAQVDTNRSFQYAFRKVEYVSMQYQYSASQHVLVRVSTFHYRSARFSVFQYNTIEYVSVEIHT